MGACSSKGAVAVADGPGSSTIKVAAAVDTKAVVAIQAHFRGQQVRKSLSPKKSAEDSGSGANSQTLAESKPSAEPARSAAGVSTVMVQRAQLTIEDLESPIKRSMEQAQDKPDKVNKENNPGRGPTGAASGAQAAPLQMPREAPRRPSGPPVAEANLLAPIKPVGKLAPIGSRQTLAPINNLAPLARPSLTPLAKPPLAAVPVGAAAR